MSMLASEIEWRGKKAKLCKMHESGVDDIFHTASLYQESTYSASLGRQYNREHHV